MKQATYRVLLCKEPEGVYTAMIPSIPGCVTWGETIEEAIANAQKETGKPSLIAVRTIIGYGSPLQNTSKAHGSPLGADNVKKTKAFFGWDPEKKFFIPEGVSEHMLLKSQEGATKEKAWNALFEKYKKAFAKEATAIELSAQDNLPENWKTNLPGLFA